MAESVSEMLPERLSLRSLRDAAAGCTACPLYRDATQTVFGEGRRDADVVAVGEQPGDAEDRRGHPFVGPAGRVLSEALADAGIDPERVYETNVVKHFKWRRQGKRRLHQKPNRSEIEACRPWLDAELEVVRPEAVVLLGATAAQALVGRSFRVTRERGKLLDSPLAPVMLATVHPSSVLRAGDDRREAMAALVDDLRVLADALP